MRSTRSLERVCYGLTCYLGLKRLSLKMRHLRYRLRILFLVKKLFFVLKMFMF